MLKEYCDLCKKESKCYSLEIRKSFISKIYHICDECYKEIIKKINELEVEG